MERLKRPLSSSFRWRNWEWAEPYRYGSENWPILVFHQGQCSPRVSGQQMEGGKKQRFRDVTEGTLWGCCFLLTGSTCARRIPVCWWPWACVCVCVCVCVWLCKEELCPPYCKFWVQVVRRSRRLTKATHNLPSCISIRIYSAKNKDGSKITPWENSVVIFSTNYFSTDNELALFQIRL